MGKRRDKQEAELLTFGCQLDMGAPRVIIDRSPALQELGREWWYSLKQEMQGADTIMREPEDEGL